MFSQSREIFRPQCDRSPQPAHSLVTEVPPKVAPEVSAFGIRRQQLPILPPGNIEIAIDLAAAEQQVQPSLALGVCGCLQRARRHRRPLHAIPSSTNVVGRGGWAASFSSVSPTTFLNHARRLLPAKSMPPNSSASSSWLSTTLLCPASA